MADSKKNVPIFPKLNKPNFKDEALKWHRFGFTVIPIIPGKKSSVEPWSYWEKDKQTEEHIKAHWAEYPKHEVGAVTDDGFIVLDADTPEAITAIEELEKEHEMVCDFIVTTSRGQHRYYKRENDVFAKQDSHDGKQHPKRIDIRTDRSLIILPPSGPRKIKVCNVEHVEQLTAASQEFIDAIFKHNGRNSPRPHEKQNPSNDGAPISNHSQAEIRAYLDCIDPDCGYEDWRNIGMALHNEFDGNDVGLDTFDEWSSKGSKYGGQGSLNKKWQSFANYNGTPVTIGTLLKMAIDNGADIQGIQSKYSFELCDTETIHPLKEPTVTKQVDDSASVISPLHKYALNGQSKQFRSQMQDDMFVLDGIALLGQMTLIYSPPNTGKTLLVLFLLMAAIKSRGIQPENVIYINADDHFKGLTTKLEMAEDSGFMMLCPGHNDFRASEFITIIIKMTESNQSRGVIIILDTIKKFTDPMSKNDARNFWAAMRNFIAKGGTVISLAHTNKNLGSDGKPIYAGTSDSLDDTDCAFTLRTIDTDSSVQTKTVELECIKSRGDVVNRVAYQYSTRPKIPYGELIDSVVQVDGNELASLSNNTSKSKIDEPRVIDAITDCISEGINKKMELAKAVAEATGESRNAVTRILEKYTGTNPLESKWNFKVVERGAKVFYTLDSD